MFGKVQGRVGTSTTMMVIAAVVGVVMIGIGIAMTVAGFAIVGVPWMVLWAGFTAWDIYRATNARSRRITGGAGRSPLR